MKYDMDVETANLITSCFLKKLQTTKTDKMNETLDEWRLRLWREALGHSYEKIADAVYRQWLAIRYEHLILLPNVNSMLERLQCRYQLALLTNGASEPQWEKIRNCGLQIFFNNITISGETLWKKPQKEIFLKVCDELNVQPENCIMVGDRVETDICGAKLSNFASTVWINHGASYQRPPTVDNIPDFIVNSVLELEKILLQ